ncbi:MAG: hypothetical protein K8R87_09505 [Verrucomicrobia bacterium]|nr:hypothetical protein [Verrucomicrobiota bacterium]
MTSLAPSSTQLPEPFAFTDEAATLRPAAPPLSPREEVRLHILAHELVRHEPLLARRLADHGMARLYAELVEA